MVNYGNSKALVAVAESQPPSAPALNSGRDLHQRPTNPAQTSDGSRRKAWGVAGTVLSGQPLAIEYNSAVLEDKPGHEDEFPPPPNNVGEASESTQMPAQTAAKNDQHDGFFITEDLNQPDDNKV